MNCTSPHTHTHTHFFKPSSRQSHKICITDRYNPSPLFMLLYLTPKQDGPIYKWGAVSSAVNILSRDNHCAGFGVTHTYTLKTILRSPYPMLSKFQTVNALASGTTDCFWISDIKVKKPISNYQSFTPFRSQVPLVFLTNVHTQQIHEILIITKRCIPCWPPVGREIKANTANL